MKLLFVSPTSNLHNTRREAAAHPRIKTAEALIRRVDEEVVMEASTSSVPIHRPSSEWRSSFLSRFSNMRQVSVGRHGHLYVI